jgi:hypothetical protein
MVPYIVAGIQESRNCVLSPGLENASTSLLLHSLASAKPSVQTPVPPKKKNNNKFRRERRQEEERVELSILSTLEQH